MRQEAADPATGCGGWSNRSRWFAAKKRLKIELKIGLGDGLK
jgi:hypothetical protein